MIENITKTINFAAASLLFGVCSFGLICLFVVIARVSFWHVPASVERSTATKLGQSIGGLNHAATRAVVEPLPVV